MVDLYLTLVSSRCGLTWQNLVAVVDGGGGIYTSTDSGSSWTLISSAPTNVQWKAVASSGDGKVSRAVLISRRACCVAV